MCALKETNFFTGPEEPAHADPDTWWRDGQWHRGLEWYTSLFDADAPVRGEASPGYTSPGNCRAPERMARVVPEARLLYLVRDPVERAISQYEHHVRDGTEHRPVEEAILDLGSQYLSRGRYFDRLAPFLRHFDELQIHVVVLEQLRDHRRRELTTVFEHVGADPSWWGSALERHWHVGHRAHSPSRRLRRAVLDRVGDDVAKLRAFLDDDLAAWDGPD